MLLRDTSPDVHNLTFFLNCSDDDVKTILSLDSQKYHLADNVIPVLTIIFSVIGVLINAFFVYLVIHGLRAKQLPFKGYSLLLNRSITDLLTGLLTFFFVALHKFTLISTQNDPEDRENTSVYEIDYMIPHGRKIFTFLLTINFWAAAGCYAVLALFTYLAVQRPIFYLVSITDRRTVLVMAGIWLIGALYSTIVVIVSANNAFNAFSSSSDLVQWTVTSGDYSMAISNLIIVIMALIVVTTSYVAIIVYLWKKQSQSGLANVAFSSIARLALNIFAFTTTCVVMAGFVCIPLVLKSHIDALLREAKESECETLVDAYRLSLQLTQWTTAAMTGWQLRMISDPVANLLLDARFKDIVKTLFGDTKDLVASHHPGPAVSVVASEFLRKCASLNVTPVSILKSDGHYFRFRSATIHEATSSGAGPPRRNLRRFEDVIPMQSRVL